MPWLGQIHDMPVRPANLKPLCTTDSCLQAQTLGQKRDGLRVRGTDAPILRPLDGRNLPLWTQWGEVGHHEAAVAQHMLQRVRGLAVVRASGRQVIAAPMASSQVQTPEGHVKLENFKLASRHSESEPFCPSWPKKELSKTQLCGPAALQNQLHRLLHSGMAWPRIGHDFSHTAKG